MATCRVVNGQVAIFNYTTTGLGFLAWELALRPAWLEYDLNAVEEQSQRTIERIKVLRLVRLALAALLNGDCIGQNHERLSTAPYLRNDSPISESRAENSNLLTNEGSQVSHDWLNLAIHIGVAATLGIFGVVLVF